MTCFYWKTAAGTAKLAVPLHKTCYLEAKTNVLAQFCKFTRNFTFFKNWS